MRPAACKERSILVIIALVAIPPLTVGAENVTPESAPTPGQGSGGSEVFTAPGKLPKLWHSESTKRDFRVEVASDVFRAVWVNLPPAAAKQGAYIHTLCRRSGVKWVGSSSLNLLFAVPGAPPGKDTKLCRLTVRFEVDSISPEKITAHSEKLVDFDVNTCKVRRSGWVQFTWIPKR